MKQMNRIKTLKTEAVTYEGCEGFDGPAETVVLHGYLNAVGFMVPAEGPHPVYLEVEVDAGTWCRETGERVTFTWSFSANHRIEALSMLVAMVERVQASDEREDELVAA